ncbi:hypothetical protein [Microbulbifer sp. TYP-18]|uniref:hypothetical protein n=1 Tax=Microbulbifer sp. TYP-18 TaxID=3230024 RepID=UPI0034C6B03C
MTKLILWFLGLAILVLSIAVIARPRIARDMTERLNQTGYAVSAWARVTIGLILLLIGDTHAWNILFNVLGILMVLTGTYMLFIGFERTKALSMKISASSETVLRLSGAIGVLLALLLLSAT